MTTALKGDAAFRWTESGQDHLHYLASKLYRPAPARIQRVDSWQSADLTTIRRVSIGSSAIDEIRAVVRWDGSPDSLLAFLAAARRGAALEYFPSVSNPSESYPCELISHQPIETDPDYWWDGRYQTEVRLRRTDGGNFQGVLTQPLFYYTAGNDLPGLTFTRSGAVGPYVDEDGVLQSAAANIVRTDWIDTDSDDVHDTPTLLLEAARTNLVTDDNVNNWTDVNTSTVTGSISDPAGGTGAYNIAGDGGSVNEGRFLGITFTGDGTKGIVFVVEEGTMPASGNQQLQVFDSTAGTSRLALNITGWSGGEPTITAGTGTLLGKRFIGSGWWAVYAQATGVVAANINRVYVYANVDASAGDINLYRANPYDTAVPGWSILDASETRNVDTFYGAFTHAPQALTVYARFRERGTILLDGSTAGVVNIGDATTYARLYKSASSNIYAFTDSITGTAASPAVSDPSIGDLVELRGVLNADLSKTMGISVNEGTESTDSDATTGTMPGAWGATRVDIGSIASGSYGLFAFESVKIAKGVKTMAEMRAL